MKYTTLYLSVIKYGLFWLYFQFDDAAANADRYRVPLELSLPTTGASNPKYKVQVYDNDTFSFRVVRRDTTTTMWVSGFLLLCY